MTQTIDRAGVDLMVGAGLEVVVAASPTRDAILARVGDADALVVRAGPCTREIIDAAPCLRVIGKHGVGLDNIDVGAATDRGIPVFHTADAATEAVAEMALAMILALARQLQLGHRLVEEGRFHDARGQCQGVELQGKTLGLIGLGRIGSRVASICRAAFGMRVVAYDPNRTAAAPADVEVVAGLADVLQVADVLSIHCPLTPETRGLIGVPELAMMKASAYLINTARGAIVDEAALAEALRSGHLAGAGIDAFAEEPPPPDHPLKRLENALLTPHISGTTAEAVRAMAVAVAEAVVAALRGDKVRHVVNPSVYLNGARD